MESLHRASEQITVDFKGESKKSEANSSIKDVQQKGMNEVHKKESSSTSWKGSISDPNSAGILYVAIQKGMQAIGRAWNSSNITSNLSMANIGRALSNILGRNEQPRNAVNTEAVEKQNVSQSKIGKLNTVFISEVNPIELEAVVFREIKIAPSENSRPIQSGIIQQGNSYKGEVKLECDVCHLDAERGFSFVMDGCGHTNEKMGNAMRDIKKQFIDQYTTAFDKEAPFITKEAGQEFMKRQVSELGSRISNYGDGIFHVGTGISLQRLIPSLALTQVITVIEDGQEKTYLLTAEKGDSPTLILRTGENDSKEIIRTLEKGTKSFDKTIGKFGAFVDDPNIREYRGGLDSTTADGEKDKKGDYKTNPAMNYSCIELLAGDQVLSCTDGITEFNSGDNFKTIAFSPDPMVAHNNLIKFHNTKDENGNLISDKGKLDFNNQEVKVSHREIDTERGKTEPSSGSIDDLTIIRYNPFIAKRSVGQSI